MWVPHGSLSLVLFPIVFNFQPSGGSPRARLGATARGRGGTAASRGCAEEHLRCMGVRFLQKDGRESTRDGLSTLSSSAAERRPGRHSHRH
uniref:Secreted protein n=1 Tax=Oryza rufipogon TaxID=4529 RepID=A0A0E0QHF8_ORYRU